MAEAAPWTCPQPPAQHSSASATSSWGWTCAPRPTLWCWNSGAGTLHPPCDHCTLVLNTYPTLRVTSVAFQACLAAEEKAALRQWRCAFIFTSAGLEPEGNQGAPPRDAARLSGHPEAAVATLPVLAALPWVPPGRLSATFPPQHMSSLGTPRTTKAPAAAPWREMPLTPLALPAAPMDS